MSAIGVMVSHGHYDAQILKWPHSFLKLYTDRHPPQERLCIMYISDTQLVICSNGPSIWSDRFRGPWIGIVCVCVCVRARARTCTHVSRIFLPSVCTTHKTYKFWNLPTTDYKTQCTNGKECHCSLLQTSDFLQLIFPNIGTAADEWSASAMVTLPSKYLLDRRTRLGRLQSQCGNDGEGLYSYQELNPQLFTIQPTAQSLYSLRYTVITS